MYIYICIYIYTYIYNYIYIYIHIHTIYIIIYILYIFLYIYSFVFHKKKKAFLFECLGSSCFPPSFPAQRRLRNVWKIHATHFAFTAICGDGTVVTWGNPESPGRVGQGKWRMAMAIRCGYNG